jgi:glycosyltransferase involved in cell wall biosynthesis
MKKKILFIITYLELGGAQKQLLYILKSLDRNKYSLYLYAGNEGYLKEDFLNIPDVTVKLDSSLKRKINPFLDLPAFLKLFFFLRRNSFDIVHTHSPKASILGRWAAFFSGLRNIVYTVHGWPFHDFMHPLAYYFYLFLEKITAKITKKIIVPSQADLKIGLEKKIASLEKLTLIHYGVEIEVFDKIYQERKKVDKRADLIFTISSLKKQKGIFYFLTIAKMLLLENPRLNFTIAGDGPLRRKVKEKINNLKLKDKVQLVGWSRDIAYFLKRADIFILTSLWEGLPVSLIEAVIAGVPVIVTDTGGIRDIVTNNQQGLIIKPVNILEIRKSCQNILKNYADWHKIIEDNRKKLDLSYWSYQRMLGQLTEIYDRL